jgi:HAD superfamily hydrolase (TIGR01509 family)
VSSARYGVLFDVDGTLVDTTYLHAVCWAEALRQHGHTVPMADVHHLIGMSGDRLLDQLLGEDRDKDGDEELENSHLTLYRQHWGRLVPLPGAKKLLTACAQRGLAVVLASSASEEELAALTSALDADDAITEATSSADADSGKPAPDILQAALDQSDVDRQRCVFVGDAVWDVEAAGRLKIPCIGLACGGTSAAELTEAGAVATYRDPAELLSAVAGGTAPIMREQM